MRLFICLLLLTVTAFAAPRLVRQELARPADAKLLYHTHFGWDIVETDSQIGFDGSAKSEPRYIQFVTNKLWHSFFENGFARDVYEWNIYNEGQGCTLYELTNGTVVNFEPATVREDMKLWEAWKVQSEAPDVTVGIIDTGVAKNHVDLRTVLNGVTITYSMGHAIITQGQNDNGGGHGTFIAGLIAAWNTNVITSPPNPLALDEHMIGVAPKTKIYPITTDRSLLAQLAAWDHAVTSGVKIVNYSDGWPYEPDGYRDAMQFAKDNGVIVVCAARDDAYDLSTNQFDFPTMLNLQGFTNIISVGAMVPTGLNYTNSSSGTNIVIAPGRCLVSCGRNGTNYVYGNGTSFAAPQVCGVLALMWQKWPSWTWQQIVGKFYASLDPVPLGSDSRSGVRGKVNAHTIFGDPGPIILPAFTPLGITPEYLNVKVTGVVTLFSSADLVTWTSLGAVTGPTNVPISTISGSLFYKFQAAQ